VATQPRWYVVWLTTCRNTTHGGRVALRVRPRTGRGVKRAPEDIEALAQQFTAFVKANPGLRIEQINKQLGTTTKDLALPIRKLMGEGMIKGKGEKRSRQYFASEGKRKKS